MNSFIIHNALVVNEGRSFLGGVLVVRDRIAEVFEGCVPDGLAADFVYDAGKKWLLPGVIDEHVHFRDPGMTHKADMRTESRAAAAGGVTSFMDMPNTSPQTVSMDAWEEKNRMAAEKSVINYAFYFGATNTNSDLLSAVDVRHTPGVKLFMGASTGNMLVDRIDVLERVFRESPVLIATHCEDQAVINDNMRKLVDKYGGDAPVELHPVVRSREACVSSTRLAVSLAERFDARLHVLHVSTADELALFSGGPILDKRITAEVTAAHLSFCDDDYRRLGAMIKCNPAIKTSADRDALVCALAGGRIDTVGTDHAPHLLKEKRGGCVSAVSGMPSIQFSLPVMLELARGGALSRERVVEVMCHNPALIYGVKERGFIRPGYKADLVLVDAGCEWTLGRDEVVSRCGWSPFEGRVFHHRVASTFVNGSLVFDGNDVVAGGRGELLEFDR